MDSLQRRLGKKKIAMVRTDLEKAYEKIIKRGYSMNFNKKMSPRNLYLCDL